MARAAEAIVPLVEVAAAKRAAVLEVEDELVVKAELGCWL